MRDPRGQCVTTANQFWLLVMLLTTMLFPASATASSEAASRTDVTFKFDANVSAEDQLIVREGIRFAQDYLIDTFGVDVQVPVTVNVTFSEHNRAEHASFEEKGVITSNMWDLRGYSYLQHLRYAVHGYVHLWQFEQADIPGVTAIPGPSWMVEGAADYLSLDALAWGGLLTREEAREFLAATAQGAYLGRYDVVLPPLRQFETYAGMFAPDTACCSYQLSALAVQSLVETTNISQLAAYYSSLNRTSWKRPFEDAFGMSPDAFYKSFEAQRPELLAMSGVDITQLLRTPIFNSVPATITLGDAPATAEPGQQITVLGWSGNGSACTMTVVDTQGATIATLPTYADTYGLVFWLWSVPMAEPPNTAMAWLQCGAEPVSTSIAISTPTG